MNAQALVLAGGLGTRLGDITKDVPKPMVSIGGKPFLEYLLEHLADYGIRDFVICVGYLADVIQEHFEDGHDFGWKIRYSVEKELLGTGGAIQKAAPMLIDNFFVISGDNYLEVDFRKLMALFEHRKATGVLSCWTNEPPVFRKNVRFDPITSKILDYHFSDATDKNLVDVGVKIFSQKLFDYFPDKEKFSLEIDVLPEIAKAGQLFGLQVANPPYDVGTIEGLEETRKMLGAKK